jgi:outer membrane protein W
MKKIILMGCMVVATAATSFGQTYAEVEKASTETPLSMEILVNGGGTGINWTDPTLRLRYFFTDNIAARVQIGLGDGLGTPSAEFLRYYENADGTGGEGTVDISRSSWNAQVGGEYHFAGTQKLSPYAALGINFGGGSRSEAWDQADGSSGTYVEGLTGTIEGGYGMFGIGLGAGMDFYFVENVYVGLELGFGWSKFTYDDSEVETTFTSGGTTTISNSVGAGRTESFIGTNAALRLGWRF